MRANVGRGLLFFVSSVLGTIAVFARRRGESP